MKLKMSDSIQLYDLFTKIVKDAGILPIRTAYKLSKLLKATESDHEFYVNNLNELIQTYAERDENGNPALTEDGNGIRIRKDGLEEFEWKINSLWTIETTVPDIKLTFEELEGLKLTVEEVSALEPFIEE